MNSFPTCVIARVAIAVGIILACGCSDNKPSSVEPANVSLTVERGTSQGTPTLVATKVISMQARVDAVDYDTRSVVLTGPEGNEESFTVDPAVVNFSQVQKGDLVTAKFTQKLAISVEKPGSQPDVAETGMIALPGLGSKPGILATRTGQITATVTWIDHDARMVSLQGPAGNGMTFQVAPQAQGLENVQAGDKVVAYYTEAVEITVSGS
jgi:hypothetical protein